MTASSLKRILITAGGTGGHVFPALAVADILREQGCEVQWLGTDRGIESRVVPESGYQLNKIRVSGLRGKGLFAKLLAPWNILLAMLESFSVLMKFKPNLVLGMGGYVSGPCGLVSKISNVPLVIHEQNAKAGTTNRYLAKVADKVLTAFPNVLPQGIHIGNPIRKYITDAVAPENRFENRAGPFRLLIMGGSLGAQVINEMIPPAVAQAEKQHKVEVWHQTGERHLQNVEAMYQELNVSARVAPFIDDVSEALQWADLIICRSGALTVSEISAVGVPSILIPYPYAIDDHQTANAMWLVDQGAAEIFQQTKLTVDLVLSLILKYANDRAELLVMAKSARSCAKPGAANECAQYCLELANA